MLNPRHLILLLAIGMGSGCCFKPCCFHHTRTLSFVMDSDDLETPQVLDVQIPVGSINITGVEGDGIHITYEVKLRASEEAYLEDLERDCELEQKPDPSRFVVRAPHLDSAFQSHGQRSYHMEIRVGRDVEVLARLSVGSLSGHRLETGSDFQSSTGSITLEDCAGPIRAHTSVGSIHLANHRGTADCRTSTGSIRAAFDCVEGDGPMRFATSVGSVRLTLPPDIDAEVTGATSIGSIHCEEPLIVRGKYTSKHVQGTLGQGGRLIEVNTSTGSITIRVM